jgi:hypothetical protein
MGESEKFTRHILPGLVFLVFILLLAFSINYSTTLKFIKSLDTASALFAFASTGVVGYLINNIYFFILEITGSAVSHNKIIEVIRNSNAIKYWGDVEKTNISDVKTWTIANILWYINIHPGKSKELSDFVARFSHLMHGIGTTIVSISLSIIVGSCLMIYMDYNEEINLFPLAFILSFIMLSIFCFNYFFIKRKYLSLINSTLATALANKDLKNEMETFNYSE